MKMNRTWRIIFSLVYGVTIIRAWLLGIFIIQKHGIYTGDLPESGRELLDFYASHPLHGFLNMFFASMGMPACTIFCLLGMELARDASQSFFINCIMMSIILSGNCFMFSIYEWGSAVRSY